jgi:hypothetical protein
MRKRLLLASAAFAGVGLAAVAAVPEDLIVKLREPTMTMSPAELQAVAGRLSQDVGVPLLGVRATSGDELVLSVDRRALGERLLAAARAMPGVTAAEMTVPGAAVPQLEIALQPAAGSGLTDPSRLASVSERLARATGAPLEARIESGRIIVRANADELLGDVSRRLQALPEVTYAQPNLVFRIRPPDEAVRKPL